jgi:hypothetical protein
MSVRPVAWAFPTWAGPRVTQPSLRHGCWLEQLDPCFAGDNLAARRENGRHINQVLLLDIRVVPGKLECREGMAMDASLRLSRAAAKGAALSAGGRSMRLRPGFGTGATMPDGSPRKGKIYDLVVNIRFPSVGTQSRRCVAPGCRRTRLATHLSAGS